MKGNSYKKQTSGLCHFCDYTWNCRKNHKCNYYKNWNKKFKKSVGGRMPKPQIEKENNYGN